MWEEALRASQAWARYYAQDPHDADDLAQEAMLRAWRSRETLRDPARLRDWVGTIVRNEAARRYSARVMTPTAPEAIERLIDQAAAASSERPGFEDFLTGLSTDEQQLLMLRYDSDLTQAAIAAILHIPEGTVKVRLHRARGKLRKALTP